MTKEELQSILDEHVGLITVKEEGMLVICKATVGETGVYSEEKGDYILKLRLSIDKTEEKLIHTSGS